MIKDNKFSLNNLPKPWKFYMTAGRDGCDIFHVCLFPTSPENLAGLKYYTFLTPAFINRPGVAGAVLKHLFHSLTHSPILFLQMFKTPSLPNRMS